MSPMSTKHQKIYDIHYDDDDDDVCVCVGGGGMVTAASCSEDKISCE